MPGVGRVAKTHWQRIERSGRPPAPRIGRIGCVGLAGSALGDGNELGSSSSDRVQAPA